MDSSKAPAAPTFLHPIVIQPQDIDLMGHVNNAVYLQWVQEAVVAYWQRNASEDARNQLLWVALKHEITYHLPLFLGDGVEAGVRAIGTRGSRATFVTRFRRGEDVAAEVRSSWCCVDAETRRPRRIEAKISDAFLSKDGSSS